MAKVSLITAIYNTEKYLSICLDSILNQTFCDIEIICINDGSTDSSLNILEHYAQFDNRIKIISTKNAGLSAARNKGLSVAEGKYVMFVDSDDWIVQTAVEKMYKNAEKHNSDFAFCNIWTLDDISKQKNKFGDDIPKYLLKHFKNKSFNYKKVPIETYFQIPCVTWNKIYNLNFLIKNNIKFIENMIFEDNPFFASVYLNAKKISFIDEFLYFYRVNRNNSLTKMAGKGHLDCIKSLESVDEIFKSHNEFDKYKTGLLILKMNILFLRLEEIDPIYHHEFCSKIRDINKNIDFDSYNIDKLKNNPNFNLFLNLIGRSMQDGKS